MSRTYSGRTYCAVPPLKDSGATAWRVGYFMAGGTFYVVAKLPTESEARTLADTLERNKV